MNLWSKSTIRNVLQAAGVYVAATLALWGALDIAVDAFSLQRIVLRSALMASAAGFPIAILITWFMSLRQTKDISSDSSHSLAAQWTGIVIGGVAAVSLFALFMATIVEPVQTDTAADTGIAAIAVLPFDNLSDDGKNQHFVDGIADDVVTSLQSWGSFPVIPRLATEKYRDSAIEVPAIAAALGVRYVLLGSVRTAGDKIRVTAQLVDGRSNTQLWASRYDRKTTDIFAIQDEITEEIVTAIAPEMARSEMNRGAIERPAELATWELVIRAHALILQGSYESTLEADELLKLSMEREPGYALAYVRSALIGHNIATSFANIVGQEAAAAALARGLDHARTAVRLNPLLVEARIWLGHLLMHDRQIERGVVELREAVRLNPSHAQAHAELGFGLAISGEYDEAFKHLRESSRLSPNDPNSARIKTFEAFAYLYAGRNAEASTKVREVIEVEKGSALNNWAYLIDICALVRQDRLEEARARAEEFTTLFGEIDWPSFERGAWSQEQLDLVRQDMIVVGLLPGG